MHPVDVFVSKLTNLSKFEAIRADTQSGPDLDGDVDGWFRP